MDSARSSRPLSGIMGAIDSSKLDDLIERANVAIGWSGHSVNTDVGQRRGHRAREKSPWQGPFVANFSAGRY